MFLSNHIEYRESCADKVTCNIGSLVDVRFFFFLKLSVPDGSVELAKGEEM